MKHRRQKEFMEIAMKHFPEGKERLKKSGINISLTMIPVFMDLFTKVMDEAYELGKRDAEREKK